MNLIARDFKEAVKNTSIWMPQKDALGFSTYAAAPTAMDPNDFMLITSSYIIGKDMRNYFDMWGIDYTPAASSQVAIYNFGLVDKLYFQMEDVTTPSNINAPISMSSTAVYTPYITPTTAW